MKALQAATFAANAEFAVCICFLMHKCKVHEIVFGEEGTQTYTAFTTMQTH